MTDHGLASALLVDWLLLAIMGVIVVALALRVASIIDRSIDRLDDD